MVISNGTKEKSEMSHVFGTINFDTVESFVVELRSLSWVLDTRETLTDDQRKHIHVEFSICIKKSNIRLQPSHFRRAYDRCNDEITHLCIKKAQQQKNYNTLPRLVSTDKLDSLICLNLWLYVIPPTSCLTRMGMPV